MTPRVFAVQRPAYFDQEKRGWVNKYDLTPAEAYGELIFILPPGNIYRGKFDRALSQIQEELEDFTEDDFILAVGDPVAIAASVMAASNKTGGRVNILKYDRIGKRYDSYTISMPLEDH